MNPEDLHYSSSAPGTSSEIYVCRLTRPVHQCAQCSIVNIRRSPSSVSTSSQCTSSMFSTTKCAPHPSICSREWLVHTAITTAPDATPALMPLGESSKTTQRDARYPRHSAARRNGSGAGLPARRRGSSAVIVTAGGDIPTRAKQPYAMHADI
jgi:hypothetical protein